MVPPVSQNYLGYLKLSSQKCVQHFVAFWNFWYIPIFNTIELKISDLMALLKLKLSLIFIKKVATWSWSPPKKAAHHSTACQKDNLTTPILQIILFLVQSTIYKMSRIHGCWDLQRIYIVFMSVCRSRNTCLRAVKISFWV